VTLLEDDGHEAVRKIIVWLKDKGFNVEPGTRYEQPFNTGVWLDGDLIVVDVNEVHPGDLLHEAGHLAVLPSLIRGDVMPGDVEKVLEEVSLKDMGQRDKKALFNAGDQAAISWAYAAAIDANVDPWMTCEKGFSGDAGATVFAELRCGIFCGIEELVCSGFLGSMREFPKLRYWRQP
jgi:hypothetical protein